MRPIPVSDELLAAWRHVQPSARRSVLAAPSGDLTDPDVGALEVIWHPVRVGTSVVTAASSFWVPDPADFDPELISSGLAALRLTVYGAAHPPVALDIVLEH